ncbi:hypothetical protein FLW53_00540 [Microbispora sp. SCL1-1]|nr:hypothetical protein FLW53_00540 [Microbispora sp. SCL1-1]
MRRPRTYSRHEPLLTPRRGPYRSAPPRHQEAVPAATGPATRPARPHGRQTGLTRPLGRRPRGDRRLPGRRRVHRHRLARERDRPAVRQRPHRHRDLDQAPGDPAPGRRRAVPSPRPHGRGAVPDHLNSGNKLGS